MYFKGNIYGITYLRHREKNITVIIINLKLYFRISPFKAREKIFGTV